MILYDPNRVSLWVLLRDWDVHLTVLHAETTVEVPIGHFGPDHLDMMAGHTTGETDQVMEAGTTGEIPLTGDPMIYVGIDMMIAIVIETEDWIGTVGRAPTEIADDEYWAPFAAAAGKAIVSLHE